MTKENKDYGKSVKAKLLNLSKAERLPYQPLLIRYVQERLYTGWHRASTSIVFI